jgi:hypothetical protein
MVAATAADSSDDWWIIGSAAVALHGRFSARPKDVDLLMSAADAAAFLRRCGQAARPGKGDGRFRSVIFGTWAEPPVPVEVMGALSVATANGWEEVALQTREAVPIGGATLFVPAADELAELLVRFGRDKDLDRATLLRSSTT